jgi:hypothetical protein
LSPPDALAWGFFCGDDMTNIEDKIICEIDDDRITEYEKRTRSGSEQIFYTGNDERDFERYRAEGGGCKPGITMHDKKDTIRIQPPERHYYALLIDGQWFWVNGCGECNGRPRDWMTYVECEKHNVCRTCGKKRADVAVAWSGENGWQCGVCHDTQRQAEKKEALDAFALAGYEDCDFMFNDQVVCPHCALSYNPDDMYEDTEVKCERCDGRYTVEIDHSVTYSTEIIDEKPQIK